MNIKDRNVLEAVEKAKEECNSHETKRTHTTKNGYTKPKHLVHANTKPPRCSKLNDTSICALEREKQAWDEVVMTKWKTGKTTKNSPWPLHAIPTKQILLPNTLSTSNIRQRKASNNQFRGRASIYPSKARWRRGRSKGRKWTDFSDFFRRSSRGTTKKPLPTHPNSSNA